MLSQPVHLFGASEVDPTQHSCRSRARRSRWASSIEHWHMGWRTGNFSEVSESSTLARRRYFVQSLPVRRVSLTLKATRPRFPFPSVNQAPSRSSAPHLPHVSCCGWSVGGHALRSLGRVRGLAGALIAKSGDIQVTFRAFITYPYIS
jgi:hypothetical protein